MSLFTYLLGLSVVYLLGAVFVIGFMLADVEIAFLSDYPLIVFMSLFWSYLLFWLIIVKLRDDDG